MAEMKNLTINGTQFTLPFAPAGYGLGVDAAVRVDDLAANGYIATQNTPDGAWAWGQQVALNYNLQSQLLQRADGCILTRTRTAGVWGEPEWLNPPMALGVEYRTTERCEGKAVYVKRVYNGKGSANGTMNLGMGIDKNSVFIDVNCKAQGADGWSKFLNQFLSVGESGSGVVNVAVVAGQDLSAYDIYTTIKYYKV